MENMDGISWCKQDFFDLFQSFQEHHWRWQVLLIQTVNVAMRFLFTQQNRTIGNIPPTNNVLLHHLKRFFLQYSFKTNCLQRGFPRQDSCSWDGKMWEMTTSLSGSGRQTSKSPRWNYQNWMHESVKRSVPVVDV